MPEPLEKIVEALNATAPLSLAEAWDNVGLLLPGRRNRLVNRVLLTVDLTASVVEEALVGETDLIVAYHPPIFKGFTRLRRDVAIEQAVLALVEAGVALYSPHTALDACRGGLNDWLALTAGSGQLSAISPDATAPDCGAGRVNRLEVPAVVSELLKSYSAATQAPYLRLADQNPNAPVVAVAVTAGAGGSVLERWVGQRPPRSLLVTGELRHHDVLAWTAAGHAVLLLEHDCSERGYLPEFKSRLSSLVASDVDVRVSSTDRPLMKLV
jgi:dinuclear metal center YbgI/SA1388 family protein